MIEKSILTGKMHDLGGGLVIHRVLPQIGRKSVGPFVFFDHMGPVEAKPGQNTDVRPHPHIGLSTLTYLFEGRIVHRDSAGGQAVIVPGEVNWMTAGKGISHSERTHPDDKNISRRMHGLQFWIALPKDQEDCEPSFQHYSDRDIPSRNLENVNVKLIAGEGFGLSSKVRTSSPLMLAHFQTEAAGEIEIPKKNFELGVYVISGKLMGGSLEIGPRQLLILNEERERLHFEKATSFILLGGAPLESPRIVWWNLVSSSREKIEAAKKQWREGTFPMVPGDAEFIPLPES